MHLHTDDEVYRVDAVWLGPPKLTFPWRARYVSYALGLGVLILVMAVQRRLGIDFGLISTAWAVLLTVAVVRFAGNRITDERPLMHLLDTWWTDVRTPRPPRRRRGTRDQGWDVEHETRDADHHAAVTNHPPTVAHPGHDAGRWA